MPNGRTREPFRCRSRASRTKNDRVFGPRTVYGARMAASNKLRVTPSHSMQPTIGLNRNQSHRFASGCASRSLAAARPPHAGTRQTGRFGSELVLTAAMVGPMVGSAALRVGAGDSRVACIETRATALHLAVLGARSQLPDHRMPDRDDKRDLGRNRCSQRR